MAAFIKRPEITQLLRERIRNNPVVAILGPRQCGKSTLARKLPYENYLDLENPRDLAFLENTQTALESLNGLTVIDEVQKKPELFSLLRYLVDQKKGGRKRKFVLLGSASQELIRQSSETLAGRISYLSMSGFSLEEIGPQNLKQLWLRGGFPRSYLAKGEKVSLQWRDDFISTYLERDIPQLGITIPAQTLRRFWTLLSHYHGQIINYSEIASTFGVSDKTVRSYIEILEGTFMVRQHLPWFENIGKRLVKSPKLYITDSGIFHSLQQITSYKHLLSQPKLGASWEGFAMEQFIKTKRLDPKRCYFWATHGNAELDLFWQEKGQNYGAEFKFADAPTMTKSLHIALEDLKLKKAWIIYPGDQTYPVHPKVSVTPLLET